MITAQLTKCNNYLGNIRQPLVVLELANMDAKENRRANLLEIIDKMFDGNSGQCADFLQIKRPQLSRWITSNERARQGIAEESARAIEKKLGLAPGALDAAELDTAAAMPQAEHKVEQPVEGYAALSSWELLSHEQREEFIRQIKEKAAENRALLEEFAPEGVVKRTVRAGGGVNIMQGQGSHKRRKTDAI